MKAPWIWSSATSTWFATFAALAVVAAATWFAFTRDVSFDEGYNLTLARTLAEDARYAVATADGYRDFDRFVSTGPGTLVPISAAFRIAGSTIEVARAAMLAFFLGAVAGASAVAYRAAGARAAALVPLAVVLAPAERSIFEFGVRALGETAAACYLLGAILLWADGRVSRKRLAAAGALAGLALLCKLQFIAPLAACASLAIAWAALRRVPLRALLIPATVGVTLFAAWQATIFAGVGRDGYKVYLHYLRITPEGIRLGPGDIAGEVGERLWSTLLAVFAIAAATAVLRGVARAGREPEALAAAAGLAAVSFGFTSVPANQYSNPGLLLLAVPAACQAARYVPRLVHRPRGFALASGAIPVVVLMGLKLRHQASWIHQDFNVQSQRAIVDRTDARLGPDGVLIHYGWPTPWAPSFLMRRLVKEAGARPPAPGELFIMTPELKRGGYTERLAPYLGVVPVESEELNHDLYWGAERRLRILALQPATTKVGTGFWLAGDGLSRLALVCEGCHPGVKVTFDGIPVRTDYLRPDSIVAYLTPDMLSQTGAHVVIAADSALSAEPLVFEVTP